MFRKINLVFVLSALGFIASSSAELPEAEVTVHVTDDESHKPVVAAEARIGFSVADGLGGTTLVARGGITDDQGNFKATARTLPDITGSVGKAGYYPSSIHHDLQLGISGAYDPRDIVLPIAIKPIGHPVAMYARKRVELELPVVGQPIGYDLIQADWVAPYGKGTIRDLIFVLDRGDASHAANLTLKFTNVDDGIQPAPSTGSEGSNLRLPRTAPKSGYERQLLLGTADLGRQKNENRNYFYRVRTTREGDQIKSAMYGKIHGEIDFDVINSKTGIVLFTYYLNPDGTPNIEFDPTKNLFTHLPFMERAQEP